VKKEGSLRFALAGCGYIGRRHAATIALHPDAELVALIDAQESAAKEVSEELPLFDSLPSFFGSSTTADALIIATPNGTHASLALEALDAGLHVLIEKPMALRKSDAMAVLQKAAAKARQAMVVLQNRYSPVSQWLKQLVESGTLGRLFFVEVNCFWNRDERYYKRGSWHGSANMDGGTLYTQFSHFIDTLYWLFGDITDINSRFFNFRHQHLTDFEDTGAVTFQFNSGGMGCLNFSTAAWEKNVESSITILAENGSVKVSGQYMNSVDHCHMRDYDGPPAFGIHDPAANSYQMLDAMIKAIRDGGPTNIQEGAEAVGIIERMYAGETPKAF